MGQYQTPSLNIRCTTGFDDSTPGTVGDTIEILNYKLCADMVEIGEWCTDNKMVWNTDKTKAMLITTYEWYSHLNIKDFSILLGEDLIQNVKVEELPGLDKSNLCCHHMQG